jgi:glycosyltransferase involved in cell wall biosynthesis
MTGDLEKAGGKLMHFSGLQRGLNPIKDLYTFVRLRRLVREFKPHIVHTHTAKAGMLGRWAASALDPAPVRIHTFHGHVLDGYFGPLRSALFAVLERKTARVSDALITVSDSVRDELLHHHRVGESAKYYVIPSGLPVLDPDCRDSLRHEFALNDATVIGFVGRMVPVKGILELLEAMPRMLAKLPGLKFLLVGDGPLKSLAQSHALRPPWKGSMILAGVRPDREAIYNACDLLVLPSRKEGLPTVALEAALSGVPVAASRIPGVCDLFEHEREALLFEQGSPDALADAVLRLARDASLARTLKERARETVMRKVPDYEEVARRHADLYRSLCKKGGSPG